MLQSVTQITFWQFALLRLLRPAQEWVALHGHCRVGVGGRPCLGWRAGSACEKPAAEGLRRAARPHPGVGRTAPQWSTKTETRGGAISHFSFKTGFQRLSDTHIGKQYLSKN